MRVFVGNVVALLSGSPAMTVTKVIVAEGDKVTCEWFDGSTHHYRTFPHECLYVIPSWTVRDAMRSVAEAMDRYEAEQARGTRVASSEGWPAVEVNLASFMKP